METSKGSTHGGACDKGQQKPKRTKASKDNKSEKGDNESDRSARGKVRCLTVEIGAVVVKKRTLSSHCATAISLAQNDHFRYPFFHFCYPLMPLSLMPLSLMPFSLMPFSLIPVVDDTNQTVCVLPLT